MLGLKSPYNLQFAPLGSPDGVRTPGWLRGPLIPASHLAPITALQRLADGSGTCAGPGRSLQAAPPPAPLPGSCPGRSRKRESGKKERKKKKRGRVNPGDSGEARAARESGGPSGGGGGARLRRRPGPSRRQPAGSGEPGARCPDHVRRSLPAATQRLGRARTARAPQASERCGGRVSRGCSPCAPGCRRVRSGGLTVSAGRVDLPAAKTFIMGRTPEGLGGDLRCGPFSEVHAQMGNLPDLYTGACVVRQRNSYI